MDWLNRVKDFFRGGFRRRAEIRVADVRMLSDLSFLERAIADWRGSPERMWQIKGQLYYEDSHDILDRRRTIIGKDGELQEVKNLPNNRVMDNQYAKMVDQKANYLLGQPFVVESENEVYSEALKDVFNRRFRRGLKNAETAALNHGVSWLYPYYDEAGEFSVRVFPGYEILPIWADNEHTRLSAAVRLYQVMSYDGTSLVPIDLVEIFSREGVGRYRLDGNKLSPEGEAEPYARMNGQGLNWSRIPLIPLKYNEKEEPLLKRVKSLQDGINAMLSDFQNNMQEDARNTILVIKNYDGEDLGEFREKLATYGAIKVRYDGDTKGGVDTLEVTVNAENYKAILEIFKKALIENAMGYDAKDDRLSGNPNQMNIQSMYSDIDLDANGMETELQATMEELRWFIDAHLANTGRGDFSKDDVVFVFNRDMMMDEGQVIQNVRTSVGILSRRTLVAQHPWTVDVEEELQRLEEEERKATEYPEIEGEEDAILGKKGVDHRRRGVSKK